MIFRTFAVIALIIGLVVGGAILAAGSLLKRGVETAGPQITGTAVELDTAKLSIFSGDGGMQGLRVANPDGFTTPWAFEMDGITLRVAPRSVMDEAVVVRTLAIDAPRITAEFDRNGRNNLRTILEHIKSLAASATGQDGAQQEARADGGKRVIIDELVIRNAQVRALAPDFDVDESLQLDEIRVEGLGRAEGGLALAEASYQVLEPMIAEAVDQARRQYFSGRLDIFTENLKEKTREVMDRLFK